MTIIGTWAKFELGEKGCGVYDVNNDELHDTAFLVVRESTVEEFNHEYIALGGNPDKLKLPVTPLYFYEVLVD